MPAEDHPRRVVEGGDDPAEGLGPSRARVLGLLQDTAAPLSAAEVGKRLGLHANSVRFHLDALVAAGVVERGRESRGTPGRPRVTYVTTASAPPAGSRRYRLLAETLAAVLEEEVPDAAAVAERAGRGWSASLPAVTAAQGATGEEEALSTLVGALADIGFEPRVAEDEPLRVEMTHCPFLEVAADHREVVCGMHLGLMRGLLDHLDAPLEVPELLPLVEPGLCVAHLAR